MAAERRARASQDPPETTGGGDSCGGAASGGGAGSEREPGWVRASDSAGADSARPEPIPGAGADSGAGSALRGDSCTVSGAASAWCWRRRRRRERGRVRAGSRLGEWAAPRFAALELRSPWPAREGLGRHLREHAGQGHAAGDHPAVDASEPAQGCITGVGGVRAHLGFSDDGGTGRKREPMAEFRYDEDREHHSGHECAGE